MYQGKESNVKCCLKQKAPKKLYSLWFYVSATDINFELPKERFDVWNDEGHRGQVRHEFVTISRHSLLWKEGALLLRGSRKNESTKEKQDWSFEAEQFANITSLRKSIERGMFFEGKLHDDLIGEEIIAWENDFGIKKKIHEQHSNKWLLDKQTNSSEKGPRLLPVEVAVGGEVGEYLVVPLNPTPHLKISIQGKPLIT